MARINRHHLSYDPEWTLDIQMSWHKVISRIQQTKATPEFYADLTNFVHSLTYEWNLKRMELDTGLDCRTKRPRGEEVKTGD